MANLRLTLALSDYVHTRSLSNGRIRPEGIDFTVLHHPFEAISFRFRGGTEFDVCEFSLANYCARVAHFGPATPMVALPVFTSRVFRHSAIFVRDGAGIATAVDLAGKRVGLPQWSQTATVYVRGLLAHDAGVDLTTIEWVQAGLNEPGRTEGVSFLQLPAGYRVTGRPEATLDAMLQAGELDAVISARPPDCFLRGVPGIRRLYPDYQAEEAAYFARTGIFPIMHAVVMRREVYEQNRWIARNLYDAFDAARREAVERLADITTSFLPTAWAPEAITRTNATLFPGTEPWAYGVAPNRTTLNAFLQYCHEQGVTERPLTTDDLFPPELKIILSV